MCWIFGFFSVRKSNLNNYAQAPPNPDSNPKSLDINSAISFHIGNFFPDPSDDFKFKANKTSSNVAASD